MVNCNVIKVDALNLAGHPQAICFINPKHPSYPLKVEWLKSRFHEGLVIKLLYVEGENRPAGFIEYMPGDQCWRAVTAPGWRHHPMPCSTWFAMASCWPIIVFQRPSS
jgi:hypothetical protein